MSRLPALLRRVGRWLWALMTWRWAVVRTTQVRDTDADPEQSLGHPDRLEDVGTTNTALVFVAANLAETLVSIGPTATAQSGRTNLSLQPDGSVHLGTNNASVDIGADGSVLITGASGGIEIGAAGGTGFNGSQATIPELPATPTAQDNADALVALGLVTQVEPVLAAGWPPPVRIPVTFADFVDVAGQGLALTDYVIPEGSIMVAHPGLVVTTPFNDSGVGPFDVLDFIAGVDPDTANTLADANIMGTPPDGLLPAWFTALTATLYVGLAGGFVPVRVDAATPVSFLIPGGLFADDGTTGEAEGILFLILP